MRQCKWYRVLPPFLALIFISFLTSCSQPPATIEEPPASQKPAEFEVGPITFQPPVAMVGDSVNITATIKNIGGVSGTYTAALSIDGKQVDSKAIPVDPGSGQEVSFQLSKSTAGSYKLAIGNSSTVLTVYNWSPYTIQYDHSDGALTGIYVGGDNGHIVRFTPPAKAFKIQKIRIFGFVKPRDTNEFDKNHVTIRIWDKDGNNQLWSQDFPWRLFIEGSWQDILVPYIRVNDDFKVEVVTHSYPAGGDPIDFLSIGAIPPEKIGYLSGSFVFQPAGETMPSVISIGFDYPQSYINSPTNRPETRSGYSYMGKLIDPGQKRLEGIQWLIRVDGEGAPGN
jgi:hypothetical protein